MVSLKKNLGFHDAVWVQRCHKVQEALANHGINASQPLQSKRRSGGQRVAWLRRENHFRNLAQKNLQSFSMFEDGTLDPFRRSISPNQMSYFRVKNCGFHGVVQSPARNTRLCSLASSPCSHAVCCKGFRLGSNAPRSLMGLCSAVRVWANVTYT